MTTQNYCKNCRKIYPLSQYACDKCGKSLIAHSKKAENKNQLATLLSPLRLKYLQIIFLILNWMTIVGQYGVVDALIITELISQGVLIWGLYQDASWLVPVHALVFLLYIPQTLFYWSLYFVIDAVIHLIVSLWLYRLLQDSRSD